MVSGFAVTERPLDESLCVIAVRGEIDLVTGPQLSERVVRCLRDGRNAVILDLSETSFVDSTGLVTLLSLLRRIDRADGCLAIACSNRTILRVFEITQVHRTLDILPDAEQAVAHVRARVAAVA